MQPPLKPSLPFRLKRRFDLEWPKLVNRWRIARLSRAVARHSPSAPRQITVAFFRPSSAILAMNLNNAFHLLTAWALQLQGARVVHFVCAAGMSRCVLGTNRDDPLQPPPCAACLRFSRQMTGRQQRQEFAYRQDPALAAALSNLDIAALQTFTYRGRGDTEQLPLGEIVLPALRWALRRHHLPDDEPTRFLMRQYILSAYNIAHQFTAFLDRYNPQTVILFNGTFYPEAMARHIARQRGLRTITHEVGLMADSAYFTDGEATAYPIAIPPDFELNPAQNARLDAYLAKRFQGDFTMAGIRFWPQMRGLDQRFLSSAANFKQIVPVFTNVIFDTSQKHANTVFPHMFAWLDLTLDLIRRHPETLFVIRAHPDENRPGKESRETVQDWVTRNQATALPNVLFYAPQDYLSSYELIQRAKFVMVYNSSIGLEASLLGAAVLCAGKARYTSYPTVFFPQTIPAFRQQAEAFLNAPQIEVPPEFARNARRFLYYQLFRTSLPFGQYLRPAPQPGFVILRPFSWRQLTPESSPTMRAILGGVLDGKPFLLEDADQP